MSEEEAEAAGIGPGPEDGEAVPAEETGYGADLEFEFYQPTQIVFGAGAATKELGFVLRRLGRTRALIVTDAVLAQKTDIVKKIEQTLLAQSPPMAAGIFDGVVPDTSVEIVDAGAKMAAELGCDAIVSVGGGSSIDTAKAMLVVLAEGGSLRDHQGANALSKKTVSHVAIPTTAGTGSEVSHYAVIKDATQKEKLHFTDRLLVPDAALLDPTLSVGMSPKLTAATGMDALTHAVEAYTAINRNPMADACSLEALRLLSANLEAAFRDGTDLACRGRMLMGANLAGMAFSSSGVGLCHAMAHVLGARYGIPHGIANAVCLPHVVRFVGAELDGRYREVAAAVGLTTGGATATAALADWLAELLQRLELPRSLAELGVPEKELGACAEQSLADGAIVYSGRFAGHLRPVLGVYRKAYSA